MKVVIATPTYDNRVGVEYLEALMATVEKGKQEGIEFVTKFVAGDSIIQSARNRAFLYAKEENPDAILWIDSDMQWTADLAIKFVKSDIDVLAAPYVKKTLNQQFAISFDSKNYTVNDNIMDIVGAGTGFLKMSRKAIDYLWDTSEPYTASKEDLRAVFEIKVEDGVLYGEDIYVCKKLSQGGFGIYADISTTLNHIGTHKFTGDFKGYLEDMQKILDKKSFALAEELGLV